jgi:tetratricopeptide (TPR) repeat protein
VRNSAGSPDKAVPLFHAALDRARCDGNDFYAIDAAHMLGIAAPQPERLDWNLQALAMTERSTHSRAKRWLAPLYNNIGWTYMDAGDAGRALDYFRKAVPAYEMRGNADDVRAAHWAVARALRATGALDDAERIQTALLAEHERAGTVDGYVFEELAELRWARGERESARDWFRKAWEALKDDPALRSEPDRLARLARLGGVTDPVPHAP